MSAGPVRVYTPVCGLQSFVVQIKGSVDLARRRGFKTHFDTSQFNSR